MSGFCSFWVSKLPTSTLTPPTGTNEAMKLTALTVASALECNEGGNHPSGRRRLSGWVGRWRGTYSALFHRPPTKLYGHLSMHTAFRSFIPIPSVVLAVLCGLPDDRDGKRPGSFFGEQ